MSYFGPREIGDKVGSAPACYGSSLGFNPESSQKSKMGDKGKGVARQKNKKKTLFWVHTLPRHFRDEGASGPYC
jgi:hypothetical protein